MEEETDQNKIEKLKKALYSRKGVSRNAHILDLHEHEGSIDDKWKEEIAKEVRPIQIDTPKSTSFLKTVLWFSVIFFVISALVASYVFLFGTNLISPKKINISVIAPLSAPAGEEMTFDINITNQNDATIQLADLLVEYPKGTRSAFDTAVELPRERIGVGDIGPGETVRKSVKIVPFGEEGEKLVTNFDFEYRVQGSNSVFNKNTSYEFTIGSSPITLKVDALKEVNSNQDLSITVSLASNSNETLKNIILIADFPFGFDIKESSMAPLPGKYIWVLGDILPQGKKTLKIKGTVIGESNQTRSFNFSVGTESTKQSGTLSATFAKVEHEVDIKKPFLATNIVIANSAEQNYVAKSGGVVSVSIQFQNNLSVPITDLAITTKLKGEMIDKKTLITQDGFYSSKDDTVKWSKFEQDDLATILPGQKGFVNFNFNFFGSDSYEASSIKNPETFIDVTVKGKRLSEASVPEEIISTATKNIRISTDAKLSSQIVHSTGSIENQGEIPPRVDQTTQYAVIWTATNNFNDTEDGKVTAILPSYVKWTGVVTPSTEKVSYNEDSREVTWDLGKIRAGSGYNLPIRQVSFQISITPSLSQVGTIPNLIGVATLTSRDTFTNTSVSNTVKEGSTVLSTDPGFKLGNAAVQE